MATPITTPSYEDEVLNIIIKVLEYVLKKHEGKGRHELNRSDLSEALGELKLVGLPDKEYRSFT